MQTVLIAFAILAIIGLVAVESVSAQLVMPAGCENGAGAGIAFNASKGRCFGHGP